MTKTTIPGSIRTLAQSREGDRVEAVCLLPNRANPQCSRCVLVTDTVVVVQDVSPDGIVVELPDGVEALIPRDCAAVIRVEPRESPESDPSAESSP
jgi:hypothetical protein